MKNQELSNLGSRIKYFRSILNISQEKLAFKCELDRTYISLLERGKRNPSLINLLKVSKGLNISLSKLVSSMPDFDDLK